LPHSFGGSSPRLVGPVFWVFVFVLFLVALEFELRSYMLARQVLFLLDPLGQPFFVMVFIFLRDRVSQTICPGWLHT
jgi:hypothetical protein